MPYGHIVLKEIACQSHGASVVTSLRSFTTKSSSSSASSSKIRASGLPVTLPWLTANAIARRCAAAQPTVPTIPSMFWYSVFATAFATEKLNSFEIRPERFAFAYAPDSDMSMPGTRSKLMPSCRSLVVMYCKRSKSSGIFKTNTLTFASNQACASSTSSGCASSTGAPKLACSQMPGSANGSILASSTGGASRKLAVRFWASSQVIVPELW
mmetsp:Transcript_35740/g.102705  ORF Transcript_35740/g.102705 Transcript_35740/m.102705 type:complete len:212 (-) Transcript_35740:180-815(-)